MPEYTPKASWKKDTARYSPLLAIIMSALFVMLVLVLTWLCQS